RRRASGTSRQLSGAYFCAPKVSTSTTSLAARHGRRSQRGLAASCFCPISITPALRTGSAAVASGPRRALDLVAAGQCVQPLRFPLTGRVLIELDAPGHDPAPRIPTALTHRAPPSPAPTQANAGVASWFRSSRAGSPPDDRAGSLLLGGCCQ